MVSINHPSPFVGIAVLVRISFNNDFSFRPRLFVKSPQINAPRYSVAFCTIPITQPVESSLRQPNPRLKSKHKAPGRQCRKHRTQKGTPQAALNMLWQP